MIRLSEIRQIYPMYSDMTDYELTSALHRKQYSHMPFEEFARQFGGPAAEDPVKIAARSFVAQNPGGGMSPEEAEAAIRAKDRSGPLGFGLNLFEGIRDAVTDELPMSLARVFRAGDIGPGDNSLATRVIQEQERDQAARVPSLQEVQNPGGWNAAAYNAPKSVVTSVAVGVPGALAGGALGGPVGAAAGAGALTYPVFYRMAKDQFVQTVYEAAERELGRPLTLGESNNLKAAIENDANEFGLYEAAPEAVSNVFTAGLFGGAIGKALRGLGLGRAVDAISKRFLTRVGAKFGAEAGEELLTEGVTFQGQEGILHKYGLRDTPPTPGEFLETQGKTVVLGSVLMGGAHSAARGLRGLLQGKSEGDLRREEAEPPQADGSHALPPGGGQAALPPAGGLPALRSTPWIYGRDTAQAPPPPSMLPPAQDQLPAGRGDIVMGMDSTGRGPVSAYGREFQPPSLRTVFMDTGEDVGRNVPAQMEAPPPGAMSLRAMAEPQQTPAPQTAPAPVPPATPAPAATVEPELLAPDEEIPSGIRIVPANSSSVALEGVGDEDPATNRQLEGIGARREEKSGRIRWRLPLSRLPELEKWLEERAGSGVQSDETREAPNVAKQRTAQNGTRGIEQQRGLEPDGRGTRGEPADSLRSRKGLEGGVSGNAQETPSPRRTRIAIPGRDKLDADFEFVEADDIQTSHLPGQGFQKNPRYALENERRYHDEPASRDKVIENASKLDPDLLMDAPDANQGAPVVDREGNVLGGNGRAMSIHRAYDGSPDSAARYRQALERNAARFGLDPDAVKGMKKPMLVRRVSNAMGKGERQSLISALNEGFSYDREKRADSKSRGDRISQRTVKALANGFRGADTLRSYFDEPASAKVVEMLVHDGAIQKTELSAYIGADGLLNPDGKTLIEQALRGRVARNYEILTRLPADILGKIDAAIPHILVAEGIGKPWDITEEVRDAVELLVRFKGSGIKEPGAFLDQFDMTTGRTPRQGVSQEVVDIFRAAISQKKAAFVDMFSRYAGQADVASGRMIPVDQKETFRKTFGEEDGPGREDKMPGPSEVKPDLDNTGDGSVPPPQPAAEYGTPEKPNRTALAEYFRNRFQTGHKFGGIVEARKEASELLKGSVTAGTATAKAVDEAIELGVVLRAREIVREMRGKNAPDIEIYRALVGLHDQQPNLTVRSSTSIAQQAYSTPVPIAFLASRIAGIDWQTSVYEPTAGNGMLLIEAAPGNAEANELNPDRAEALRAQGFTVTENDAAYWTPRQHVDVVIENPPFGRVRDSQGESREFDIHVGGRGFITKELDHAIVARSLQALKQDGRAVLIVGGKQGFDETRAEKYQAWEQVRFYKMLFDNYIVLDHFSIDGKLYSKQGASYPIDVIVIGGKGNSKGRAFPGGSVPRVYKSFEELEGVLKDGNLVGSPRKRILQLDSGNTGSLERGDQDGKPTGDASGGHLGGTSGETALGDRHQISRVSGTRNSLDETGRRFRRDASGASAAMDEPRSVGKNEGNPGQSEIPPEGQLDNRPEERGRELERPVGRGVGTEAFHAGKAGQLSGQRLYVNGASANPEPHDTQFQTPYRSESSVPALGLLVPKNIATPIRQALARLKAAKGNIDQYVAKQLGYTQEELPRYFKAEQVDALALALSNLEAGSAFVIGDQTGIGKGRVNAGIIRWAKRQGKIPVFITVNGGLYADMARDLAHIGMKGFNPLPTNSGMVGTGDNALVLPDGRTLKTASAKAHDQLLADVARNGLGEYDAIFTTYDQLNDKKSYRRVFLSQIAPQAVFILDEAHLAGGVAEKQNRAGFVRSLLRLSPNGVFYSSATYAKRPDTMGLYFRTDMGFAVGDMDRLADVVAQGGVPMQQVVAAMLTESGQYIRREQTYEGVSIVSRTARIKKEEAEHSATILRAILRFDGYKKFALKNLNKELAREGSQGSGNKSTGQAGATSTNFASTMHNLIAQVLLAQKAEIAAQSAAEKVRNGEKVIIALSNTMGSAIEDYATSNGLAPGAPMDLNFRDLFRNYLVKSREVKVKDADGTQTSRLMSDEELGAQGVAAYRTAEKLIERAPFDMPASPIDYILNRLEQMGIRAGEITGREDRIDYSSGQPVYAKKQNSTGIKQKAATDFNSGKLDVLVINKSGSTGISLHSSETFKDQKPRHMIIAQAQLDINEFMQTLGRIFRTGQANMPSYELLFSDLPAEKRPAAVLAKKMASLNANTTASGKSDTSFKDVPDFMNEFGDLVAVQVMLDNPDLFEALGEPGRSTGQPVTIAAVTGRIPILPVAQQEMLYELLETEYNNLMEQLDAMGVSPLEAKALPLDARLLEEREIMPAKDVGKATPFAGSAKLGRYSVKRIGKPYSSEKVRELIQEGKEKNPDMRTLESQTEEWLERKKEELSEEAFENLQDRTQEAFDALRSASHRFAVGTPVTVSRGETSLLGVVISFQKKGKTSSPVALGAWKVDVAVADAMKQIGLSVSQINKGEKGEADTDMGGLTIAPWHGNPERLYSDFDRGQSESREEALIATGNLLSAYDLLDGGRVITFTDQEGNNIPGVLLPKDSKLNEVTGQIDIPLTPEQAVRFLREVEHSTVKLASDRDFILARTGGTFNIAVPASRAKGQQYYGDEEILEAAGQEFYKSGPNMLLRGLDESHTLAVLQALQGKGKGFVADNNRERAKEIAQGRDNDTPSASLNPGEHLPPRRPGKGILLQRVREVAEALGGRAAGAARTEAVQSFKDLPERIRKIYRGRENSLEGVYDPQTKTVYLVADNLTSGARAADVWIHEQVVHHGLRGLLSGAEREALLNRLWRELGGMGNADIKELAERYGIDPRNDERGRLQVMEEYLASLAEKAGAKLLSPRQETLWQKIVEAVRSFWARIAERITGQPSAAARIDVDKLLASLGRYVMEGRQVRAGTGAYASIGRDLSPERAAWEQVRRDTEAWGRQVEEWKKDKGEASNRALRVGKTPDVLKKLGAKAQVMAMMPRNMDKIHNKKGISLGTIKRLPQALSDPLMVFKSATMADSLVVLTELEHQGENLIAAIHLNVKHDRMTINDIASVHDRAVRDENGKVVSPGWQWFKGQIEKGNLRYYDKNRSSRWFREHSGLQLPGVLNHESYRGVKILTEKDIVKPVSPETDADEKPLASLRSLRSILNMTPREAANALDEVEIARFFKTGDITLMQRIFMLPHWIAKQQASFAKVYERQLQRMDERAAALKKSLEQVPSMFSGKGGLPKEDMDDLRKLIWENEGKEIPELKGVDKLIPDEKLANGRSTLKVNPEFYAAYEKWLTGQLGSEAARNAMLEIRKSLDNDLLIVYNRMAEMSEMEDGAIAELRKHINHVHNYFPHHRYGEYFVQAKVGDEVVYREHYDAAPGMGKIKGDKKIAGLVAEYPGAKWSAGRNRNLPEDVFGKTMDTEAMEQIIKASVSKIADKEQAGKIEAVLHAAIADTFKARGFGSHSIGRKGIPGHEKEDILRVLYDYKAGLYGWLTKMDAASDFSKALSEIDARKSPGLWSYTSEYVENMLRNSDRIDRVTGNIKAVAFAWYLGLSLKTAAVNATQNFVVGVPRLSMDVQGGGWEWIKAAGDAIHDRVTGGEGKRLAEDEERLLQELIREAIITDAYMREARGKMNSAGASAWDKFTKALGWPMSVAEKFNRASLALAAYRAARNGKLTPKAREKYGIKADEAATWEQAKAFAKAVVLDAHFVYGKSNTPEWLRGSSIGRALSPVFTFRSFSANMLNMWHWALRSQGKEGKIFVAKSLASTIALGGLTAFPFYATAMALVQAVSGDDDNWTERIRESLPEEDWLRDIVCYGLPSLTGTYIGGSLKMETPITRGVTRGETPKEILADSMGDIFGIPYDLLIVKPSRVLDAQSKGNTWRMVEEAAPVFLKNAMQAYRLATEGQTTVTGRPINDPGEPGARRISTGEAIGKALGFQPLSSTKSYEAYAARTHADRVRSDKIDELTVLALRTRDTGQPGGRIAMMKALAEWNRKMAAEGKPYMRIKPEDVDRRVSVRRRENRATPRAMEQRERMRSVWGQ